MSEKDIIAKIKELRAKGLNLKKIGKAVHKSDKFVSFALGMGQKPYASVKKCDCSCKSKDKAKKPAAKPAKKPAVAVKPAQTLAEFKIKIPRSKIIEAAANEFFAAADRFATILRLVSGKDGMEKSAANMKNAKKTKKSK